MPGQRRPMAVNLASGGKHWTAEEVEQRQASEIKTAAPESVDPPGWLSKPAKKLFRRYWKLLRELPEGILSELDAGTLALLCDAEYSYGEAARHKDKALEAAAECRKNDYAEPDAYAEATEKIAYWTKQMGAFAKVARSCANDLGCTISSRCKLVVPKVENEEDSDPLTLLQGRFLNSG